MGVGGDPDFLLLIGILTFLPIKSPYKILEPYDSPFWGFEQRYQDSGGTHFARTKMRETIFQSRLNN